MFSSSLVEVSHSELTQPKYFVESEFCKMPYVNPFSRDVMSSFKRKQLKHCHKEKELITPEFDENLRRYRLHIHKHLVKELLKGKDEDVTLECHYQKIRRSLKYASPDDTYGLSDHRALPNHLVLPKDVNFLTTSCSVQNRTSPPRVLQRDGMALIQDRLSPKELKINLRTMNSESEDLKPSVIIMGLDSTSRMNFRRTMPKVLKHVSQEGWFEMEGYNKVGDNTLPNILAVLAGTSREKADKKCNLKHRGCLDEVDFIWKRYKSHGYTTAYAEDCEFMSTFNYLLPGFHHEPVDYYLRPFLLASEELNKVYSYLRKGYCVGRHLSFRYVWDFGLQFVRRFLQRAPMFGILWTNSFTHDIENGASALDDLIEKYLDTFQQAGLFNSSVVIFMSDHGYRFTPLRMKESGYLEERLPVVYIYVPPWFRQRYPQFVENLKTNRNRLSSNYDLHMTLHHLLQLNAASMSDFDRKHQAVMCKSCQSLFFELPFNRSCEDAGITEKWCTCNPIEKIQNPKNVTDIAQAIVNGLNEYLAEKQLMGRCHQFSLGHIRRAHRKLSVSPGDKDVRTYSIEFWALPKALYEATVRWNAITKNLTMNVDQLSRLNKYENHAKCVMDASLKKFCICLDSLPTTKPS
ncbi:hypothetical protein KR018_008186 [Drosophila ironensis]|nr:hypothetical protein KR018_008186 [Drosophila ironensis]